MTKNKYPLVVIFGRTNVGKSTLFNCLIERKKALTSNVSGTTRDSNIGEVSWRDKVFTLVDTGGISDLGILAPAKPKKKVNTLHSVDIDKKVQEQAREYLTRADFILFVLDSKTGLLDQDKDMALALKKLPIKGKIMVVANKSDNPRLRSETAEFNKLALGEPIPVSAASGSGTGDLLDAITEEMKGNAKPKAKIKDEENDDPEENTEISTEEEKEINICIIGKPNSGKSSLVNSFLGEERIIVSPSPHTTREPQDISLVYKNIKFNLIDTAGITKKSVQSAKNRKLNKSLEKLSVMKSIESIKRADLALLILDITEEVGRQDAKLIDEILKRKTSLIIVANKWDLIEEKDVKFHTEQIYYKLPFVKWAPIEFVSALTGKKINKILDQALKISEQRKINLSDNALSKFLGKIVKIHAPVKGKGVKKPYVHHIKQVESDPPFFSVRVGSRDSLDITYLRFIENKLREKFGFIGTPLTLYVDKPKKVHGKHEKNNT